MNELLNLYPCPCCGYKTLNFQPPGTYLVCPICYWEDDGTEYNFSRRANLVSLREAQRNFIEFGACEREWRDDVRPPTVNEERDPNWQPIDILSEQTRLELLELIEPTRLELIEKIATAFKDVTLEDGVSIHQARALDDYEDPKEARLIDSEIRWQEIPDDWIDSFSDVLAFMDAKGLRHALPAYLIWCLKYNKTGKSSFQSVEYYLRPDDNGIPLAHSEELFNLLDEAQRKVISEFIQFLDTFIYFV